MSDNDNNKVETDEWGIPAVFKDTWFGEILRFSSKWERDSGELLDSIQKIRGVVEVYETYSDMEREAGTQDAKRTYGCAAACLAVAIVTTVKNDTKRFFGKEVEVDIGKVKPFLRDMDGRVRALLADARRAGEAMRRLPLTLLKVADLPEEDKNELQVGFEKLDARLVERIRQLDAEGESRVPAICEFATDLADMYERRVYEVFKDEVAKMRTQAAYNHEAMREEFGEMKADLQNFMESQDRDHKQFGTLIVNVAQTANEIKSRLPDRGPKKHRYGITLDDAVRIMKEICRSDAVCKGTLQRWLKKGKSPKAELEITADNLASVSAWSAWCKTYRARMTDRLKVKRYLDENRQARK